MKQFYFGSCELGHWSHTGAMFVKEQEVNLLPLNIIIMDRPPYSQMIIPDSIGYMYTGWERTVHVYRCPALYSGRIFVPLCQELIIFVF